MYLKKLFVRESGVRVGFRSSESQLDTNSVEVSAMEKNMSLREMKTLLPTHHSILSHSSFKFRRASLHAERVILHNDCKV
jgi:hypothetical protein